MKLPRSSIIKRLLLDLVMAREGRKEKAETIKTDEYACSKIENVRQYLIVHQSAWCVGRTFCGYLILRLFPNRKNSQNNFSTRQ